MSLTAALIERARPHQLAEKARAIVRAEASKGCEPHLYRQPVSLEPPFRPIWARTDLFQGQPQYGAVFEPPPTAADLRRLRVWIPPDLGLDWIRSERLVKQLDVTQRVGLEIVGNRDAIGISLLCHQHDESVVSAAFGGEFPQCELSALGLAPFSISSLPEWNGVAFYDVFPPPPYSHKLTQPAELRVSTYEPLIAALSGLAPPAIGIYQCLFQPAHLAHAWKNNVEALLDLEYEAKCGMAGASSGRWYGQQIPSGALNQMAFDVQHKAHDDKPFFFAAMRIAVAAGGPDGDRLLRKVATFSSLFQHGGRPLMRLTARDYAKLLTPEQIRDMFILGLTYRPGFLVNSLELAGPAHIPPAEILEHRIVALETLERLPVRVAELSSGTRIGTCNYAGTPQPVCLPPELRRCHVHVIGRMGAGKSTLLEHMIRDDIGRGHGIAILDPHGDLIERLLDFIPEKDISRTILLDFSDPNWVPLWNPLERVPGQDPSRQADDLVGAIKGVVQGWGDRLEHLLRNTIFASLHFPNSTLLDVADLLRNKGDERDQAVDRILQVVDNESARKFWLHDFRQYGKDDLGPPKNKLSKLLISGNVALMLSQPESAINFGKIMDEGKIVLVNLATLGTEQREILGSVMLAVLRLSALGRAAVPVGRRRPFFIYCDEAHRFTSDAVDDLITETRKYGVGLTLAHQYLSQFGRRKADALCSMGSTIIFNVNRKDAQYLVKDLPDSVPVGDITALKRGHAILRAGTDVVRFETPKPEDSPARSFRELIVAESRRRFYKPSREIREAIARRNNRWATPFAPLVPPGSETEELVYDIF